jgi:DNA polymerase III delta subunit
MAVETAMQFLRSADAARRFPPVVVIFGPHAFLREYILDAIARRLAADGHHYLTFQVGAGDDFGAVLNELRAPDLFAPKRLIACRVLRARRDRAADDDAAEGESRAGAGAGEGALAEAIEQARGPGALVLVYERDNAPAKIRRAAEKSGLLISCNRPFDDQLEQYAIVFARARGLKLAPAAADLLISRHAGDLAAISNALGKSAIFCDAGATVQPGDLNESSARRMPELFELADSVARGRAGAALSQLDRSFALGRDAFEILALEIIPTMRRMMLAAAILAARKSEREVAAVMGLAPQSNLAQNAIAGARRFGQPRLERAFWRACQLDADFKNGKIKEKEQALAGLLIDLMRARDADATARP